jgi:predicted nucleotide-binding protein (sugar kinase/HSP70/actin superfamily)
VLWAQYFPTDAELLEWIFAEDLREGRIRSPFDIADVWPSSYSANTNEILWGAKIAARVPWIAGVIRLASYECGMDQPTYTPVQAIVERSGTLFFSFQELDSTKPAGSVRIRVETIAHYLQKYSRGIIERKKAAAAPGCPLHAGIGRSAA